MTLRTIFDAYRLPPAWPKSDGFMVYAGGSAEHVWTDAEIRAAARAAPEALPVWEYRPGRNGAQDGAGFASWLGQHQVPGDCLALLAMEAYVDRPYVTDFADNFGQRSLGLYGSIDSLFNNPPQDGWWPANPTGAPHLFAHPGVIGTQYAWSSLGQTGSYEVDLSLVAPGVRLWRPGPGGAVYLITDGLLSLRELAAAHKASPAKILRMTAQNGPASGYPPALASYVNQATFAEALPAGITLWVPA